MNSRSKTWTALTVLMVIVLSFTIIVKNHDPVALLGWLFCVAVGLSSNSTEHRADVDLYQDY